jgi:hypothetical protein
MSAWTASPPSRRPSQGRRAAARRRPNTAAGSKGGNPSGSCAERGGWRSACGRTGRRVIRRVTNCPA